jgi:hypothetical protein
VLVVVVIFFPQTVTVFLDKPIDIDINSIQIEVPAEDNYGSEMDEEQRIKDLVNSLNAESKK